LNKIIFTGTAPGFPVENRACSSFILQIGSKLYQFDAGEGFSSSALKHKIKYNDIEKIFISHLHPDHIAGLFLELQLMYLSKRSKSLDIYVPPEALNELEKTIDLFYLFKEKFPFRFRFKPFKSNPVYRNTHLSLYAYRNLHLNDNKQIIKKCRKPNKMQSYSFIIRLKDKRILYSGDIKSENDIAGLLDNVHTAIVEGFHINFEALFTVCADNNVRWLVITHLDEKLFDNPMSLFKIAKKVGLKKLLIAYDGIQLRL